MTLLPLSHTVYRSMIKGVKLPAHRAGLPGKEISFFIVPLEPAYKAGLAGHLPVKWHQKESNGIKIE